MQFFPNSMEMFVDKTKYHYYYYLRLNSGDLIWIQFSFQFQKFFIHYGSPSRTRLVGYATIAIFKPFKTQLICASLHCKNYLKKKTKKLFKKKRQAPSSTSLSAFLQQYQICCFFITHNPARD